MPGRERPGLEVQAAARAFAVALSARERSLWGEMMLQFREFEAIGKDRASLETVTPFLIAGDPKNQSAAVADCENHLSLDLAVLANLLTESGHTLPIERDAALAVGGYVADANTSVFAQTNAYAVRMFEAQPDFVTAFAFKVGQAGRLRSNRATALGDR